MLPAVVNGYEWDAHEIEIIRLGNEPLFNARMVAAALSMSDSAARSAVSNMEDGEDYRIVTNSMIKSCSNVHPMDIRKLNNRGETFLTESGLYEIIIQSNKPETKAFRRWITREVLPALRKQGYYGNVPNQFQVPQTLGEALQLAADQQKQIEAQEKRIRLDAPKAVNYGISPPRPF